MQHSQTAKATVFLGFLDRGAGLAGTAFGAGRFLGEATAGGRPDFALSNDGEGGASAAGSINSVLA